MELRGSQTQIVKSSNQTRQSKAHTNQCSPSLSSELTTKMWRQHHLMLAILSPDSTLCMYLESLLIYRSARLHARGSLISLWQTSWFNQHTISLSVNQSPTPKGVVSLGMVLPVRLWEVGGSTGGALGKAFFPFAFFCGTGAVGGGAKRSTSESDDWTSFFFTSLPGERPIED